MNARVEFQVMLETKGFAAYGAFVGLWRRLGFVWFWEAFFREHDGVFDVFSYGFIDCSPLYFVIAPTVISNGPKQKK